MDSMLDASSRSYGDIVTSVEFSHRSFQERALSVQEDQFTMRSGLAWIQDTFKKRECNRFQFTEKEPDRCQCGRLEEDHSPTKTTGELEEVWKPETHTKELPTDAFGELEFQGAWTCTRAKYARISHDAKADDVLDLLTESWGLELPKLLIEITGGAKDFVLQPKLKRIFRQGIVKVAVSTNAWIITGGTNTGVMKHVGKALREHTLRSRNKIYALGVASWGVIDNRTDLMHRKNKPTKKVTHYRMTSSLDSQGASLDPNHTHFILVDDGSSGKYGVEIPLRARLQKIIAQKKIDPNSSRGIPAVCLALEGGVNTIRTVLENVSEDPPIPAVIAAGSGRAADLIAFAYEFSKQGLLESPYVDQLRAKVAEAFPKETDKHEGIMQELKKIVRRKHLITVFNVDDEGHGNDGIDYAILSALLKASNLSPSEQLKLSLIWNRVDIAQEKIFSQTTHWNDIDLHNAMEIALTRNRVDFIKPLLEQGLLMNNFLTHERLQTLYSDLEEEPFPTLQVLYKAAHLRKSKVDKVCMADIGRIIQHLLGKGFACKYIGNESKPMCSFSCKKCKCCQDPGEDETDGIDDDEEDPLPFDDLFIWAILTKKFRMAYIMWQRGRQSIAKSLIGNRLCYNLANIARSKYNTDAADEIMEECKRYEQMSIGLLDQCFAMSPEYTRCILCAKMDNWSQQTCLSLAANYHVFKFIAHPAVQDLLNHQWYGKLRKISGFKNFVQWLLCGNKSSEESNEAYANGSRQQKRQWSNNSNDGLEMSEAKQSNVDNTNGTARMDRSISVVSLSPAEMRNSTLLHNRHHRPEGLTRLKRIQAVGQAPIVKFWINTIFYVTFLFLFTYVVLHNFQDKLSWVELVVAFTVFALGTEEVRQVLMQGERDTFTLVEKIKMWAANRWNLWDFVGISFYFVGFMLRWPYGPFPCFLVLARIFLVVDIMVWYIRLLDIFGVHKIMGPYVNMIYRMVFDTMYFTVILFVFLLSYGVARQALLYPTDHWEWIHLADILAIPYWQIYGEVFMDDTGMLQCRANDGGDGDCPKGAAVVPFIMSLYLLIANVLLLNLLIAKFNNTFTRVQENANEIWKFQRYRLIIEYSERPCLPPPFIVVIHVWFVVRWLLFRCCQRSRPLGEMRIGYDEQSLQLFYNFEEECMENFLRQQNLQQQTSIPGLIQRMNERVESISLYVEEQMRHEETARKLKRKETMKRTLSSWNNREKDGTTAVGNGARKTNKFSREMSC